MSGPSVGKFDDLLYTMCSEAGGIDGLLSNIFDFLYRRTDFFYESDPGDKMGFPPGRSAQMLMKTYSDFQDMHYKTRAPRKDPEEFKRKLEIYKQQFQQKQEKQQEKQIKEVKQQPKQQEETKKKEEKKPVIQEQQQQNKKEEKKQVEVKQEVKKETKEEQTKKQESNFNTHNGGESENYKWSQNISDVSVEILLSEKARTKDMKVDIQHKKLKVEFKGEVLMEGEFFLGVKADESYWTIEDGSKLILTLEKAQENIWKTVLIGDKEIDTSKVDNVKPLQAFDGETQGAIRKIMYDQKRKEMGLPTSEEESQLDMMKKAWDAEGSPFKGQPFDPSKLNFSGNQQGQPGFNLQ